MFWGSLEHVRRLCWRAETTKLAAILARDALTYLASAARELNKVYTTLTRTQEGHKAAVWAPGLSVADSEVEFFEISPRLLGAGG